MTANTKKFLNTYNQIALVENQEVIGKSERIAHEKEMKRLNSDLTKFASKVTETEFDFLSDLCCTWEEFVDCYQS